MKSHFALMQNMTETVKHCQNIVRQDDPDRYFTTLFMPARKQEALWALYAFNQELAKTRETVSEPMLGDIRLQWWYEAIEGIVTGQVRKHPVIEALNATGQIAAIKNYLFEIIEARKQDLYDEGPASFQALESYADGVGGALNHAAYILCDGSTERAELVKAARASGRAWAMLGLVRALPFHWQTGRSYIPQQDQQPTAFQNSEKLFTALEPTIDKMLSYVQKQYDTAQSVGLKKHSVLFINKLTHLYLRELRKVGNNPFMLPENKPSSLRKLLSLLSGTLFG